jgi:alpha-1,4-digalacturonate transport system permease protein
MTAKNRMTSILLTTIVAILAVVYLFPILWLLLSSFKPGSELFSYPLKFFPDEITFGNYQWSLRSMY